MKNSEKKLLYLNTVFLSVFAICIFVVGFLIGLLSVDIKIKYTIFFIFIVVIMLLSYYMSRYFLGKSFETNHLLNLLLKDTLHELNIPLSVIKANTQMLTMGEKDEKKLKKYNRIQKACEELFGLYKDVDYYIKKEIRNEVREEFELSNFLQVEIEKFTILYPNVKIKYKLESFIIYADKRGFQKVFGNLLGNALKYNQNDNDIFISLSYNELVIKDRGIGMSESDIFLVFDRYYRGENKKSGYGIGLSIVKAFCDEYNISIRIESKLKFGTTITLDLSNLTRELHER